MTWCTEVAGKLRTVARGARRSESGFAGALDLFYLDEIGVTLSRRSDLHALREARVLDPHEGLRRSYGRLRLASYFGALIDLVTEPEHPAPELFGLLRRALGYLQGAEPDRGVLAHFERRLLVALGLGEHPTDAGSRIRDVYGRLPDDRAALLRDLAP